MQNYLQQNFRLNLNDNSFKICLYKYIVPNLHRNDHFKNQNNRKLKKL